MSYKSTDMQLGAARHLLRQIREAGALDPGVIPIERWEMLVDLKPGSASRFEWISGYVRFEVGSSPPSLAEIHYDPHDFEPVYGSYLEETEA